MYIILYTYVGRTRLLYAAADVAVHCLFEAEKHSHVGRHVYAEKISFTLQNLLQMDAKTKLCLHYISELFLKISSENAQLVYYLYLDCIISINVCITCSMEMEKKLA